MISDYTISKAAENIADALKTLATAQLESARIEAAAKIEVAKIAARNQIR